MTADSLLHSAAMAYLQPEALAELKRATDSAERCPVCAGDPVLILRAGRVEVYGVHTPECGGTRPALTVVEGGA